MLDDCQRRMIVDELVFLKKNKKNKKNKKFDYRVFMLLFKVFCIDGQSVNGLKYVFFVFFLRSSYLLLNNNMNDKIRLKNAHVVEQVRKLKNKEHQLAIIAPLIMDKETWSVRPMVEYPVKSIDDENYRIDLYYPSAFGTK